MTNKIEPVPQGPPPSAFSLHNSSLPAADPFAPVIREVAIPGRSGKFYVREFDADGAEARRSVLVALHTQREAAGNPPDFKAVGLAETILAHSVCDAEGKLLFTREQLADYRQKSALVFDRLFTAACHVNLLYGAGEAEVAAMQEFFTPAQLKKAGPGLPGIFANPTSTPSRKKSAKPVSSTGSPS